MASGGAASFVLPNFEALSEFWSYTTDCGQDAFMVTEHCLYGEPSLSGPTLDAWDKDMAAHGYGGAAGSSQTMSTLVAYASKVRKLDVVLANPWGSSPAAIHDTLVAHAGRDGIVLQVSAAHNLTGNEGGVNSHFVAIGGIDPVKGYLVANGDDVMALNANHGHGRIIPCRWMSWAVIASAQPSAAAVFPNPNAKKGATTSMPIPTGWKDDGKTLSNPTNSNVVTLGFRSFILAAASWDADDVPLENDTGVAQVVLTSPEIGGGDRQTFAKTRLGYTSAKGVFKVYVGAELLALEAKVAQLQAQLAAASTPPAPPPAVLSDAQKAAIAAAEAAAQTIADGLKQAFGS